MTQRPPIAQQSIVAVGADGKEAVICLGLGQPYKVPGGDWACPVWVDGLHAGLLDQHGVDSWQSMQLAIQLIAQLLGAFVAEGGQLLGIDDREPIEPADLFARVQVAL